LGDGSRVGTSSLRRAAQLRALGQGIVIEMLRGNVDTRLRKLDEGNYDSIVLAAAGLIRLGWQDRIRELLPASIMCPAVGQGALAIETRVEGDAFELVRNLDHAESRAAITAERAMLAALEGGCQVPIGGYAYVQEDRVHLEGLVASPDGKRILKAGIAGTNPRRVGEDVARLLLDQGAAEILSAL
jgi:hydroxymethylbilane synthase